MTTRIHSSLGPPTLYSVNMCRHLRHFSGRPSPDFGRSRRQDRRLIIDTDPNGQKVQQGHSHNNLAYFWIHL